MGIRDERAAVLRRWNRDLGDNFTAVLPRVLDDLEAIDEAHGPEPVSVKRADDVPSDAEIERWILAHPDQVMAIGMRKSVRINGSGDVQRVLGDAAPAKPATRRRRTT
jgi:hypothetical protein